MNEIKTLQENIAYQNKWMRVYFNDVEFPSGNKGQYARIVQGSGAGGVVILPIRGSKIGLVRQFRYPVGKEMLEIPRGFADTADGLVEAQREFQEEVGISNAEWTYLGRIHPDSGLLATGVKLYAAKTKDEGVAETNAPQEHLRYEWIETSEVYEKISSSEICDAFTLCAWLRAVQKGLIKI